ncbi:hypothetical protein ACOI1C_07495 [Bacillus sp. DJP31]|uniref:hypothetical protein n=1 Tax=Bacillus sp. DJP31 TaxID=3409789 RepID=UPI003BB5F9D4
MDIQDLIDSIHYWDARVLELDIKYHADEIILKCEDGEYHFLGCYSLEIKHTPKFDKEIPPRDWTFAHIPYTIHDIKVIENESEPRSKYKVEMNMFPMYINLICNEIIVSKLDALNNELKK